MRAPRPFELATVHV